MTTHAGTTTGQAAHPGLEAFATGYERGDAQVVWTRLVADLETPVLAYLKLTAGNAGSGGGGGADMSFLLESVEGGAVHINRIGMRQPI